MTARSPEADWTAWMSAALAGDSVAYREFLRSVTPYIRSVVRSRCKRLGVLESEIEDIVQEVLLTIHLKRETWDSARPIGPWVAAITRNKAIDAFRRRGRRVEIPIEDVIDTPRSEDRSPDIEPRYLNLLLERLKPKQQEIVRSISISGANIRDTAEKLKMTEGAVRVSLHRALKTLGILYRSRDDEY